MGHAGIVLGIGLSRLARTGRVRFSCWSWGVASGSIGGNPRRRCDPACAGSQTRTSKHGSPCYLRPADQLAQLTGDLAGFCQQREVVAHLPSHRPAEFARPGRLAFVRPAELEIAAGSSWPPRRRRVDFLDHGQRQPGTPGCETPPDIRIGEKHGEFPVTPPLRPRRQPAPRACHFTQPGRETGLHGLHPGAPRRRQPGIDEDIAPDCLAQHRPGRGQQRPRAAVPDEHSGLAGRASAYPSLAQVIRRPGRDRAGQVGERLPRIRFRPGPLRLAPTSRSRPAGYEPAAAELPCTLFLHPYSGAPTPHASSRPAARLAPT